MLWAPKGACSVTCFSPYFSTMALQFVSPCVNDVRWNSTASFIYGTTSFGTSWQSAAIFGAIITYAFPSSFCHPTAIHITLS